MNKTQQQPTQSADTFTSALADVLLYLRRKREARQAQQDTPAQPIDTKA